MGPNGTSKLQLQVWVGSVKMDGRGVNIEALHEMLYGQDCSAQGADVIALFLSDLLVNKNTLPELRGLLRQVVRMAEDDDDYVFNEDDSELKIKSVPAQLSKIVGADTYYSALYVCVHKRNTDVRCNDFSFPDTFPVQPMLARGYDGDSEYGVITQEVIVCRGEVVIHLMILGANLSHEQSEMLSQMRALERIMHKYHRDSCRFQAVILGDFHTRVVAAEQLISREHLEIEKKDDA